MLSKQTRKWVYRLNLIWAVVGVPTAAHELAHGNNAGAAVVALFAIGCLTIGLMHRSLEKTPAIISSEQL